MGQLDEALRGAYTGLAGGARGHAVNGQFLEKQDMENAHQEVYEVRGYGL